MALVVLSALNGAHAASYVVDVQFPGDASAKPATLNLEDHGKPQTAKGPGGLFVAVAAQQALESKLLESRVNVIDNVGTDRAVGTGVTTQYLALNRPLTLQSPAGAGVVLTLKQIRELPSEKATCATSLRNAWSSGESFSRSGC
ncbi:MULTISPECIES: hypothetical protein [Burkholderia]|uniref:Uncharacterized protein n=1 Tax=Burkholderia contaminans TaxID=488447 RepID=A0ABD7YE90_9BURK|nr:MULTISPECIES: hypothetical protein [Burkholderia]MBX3822832.1 hypothetical protein [Burkholderia contaminans]MBX3843177.1 hypothetical protein [Burkholderia contaminans]MBX3861080.1 hypothetical protein [Burkholderia contaminans]MBX3868761.1 hypothetical protein [Burkholderia contaminans]MBX3929757.1 hypothetical protein [Burkholderia contaminans]